MRTFRLRKFELRRSEPSTSFLRPSRRIEGTGRVRKKRLSWETSPGSVVERHRIYWEVGGSVDYGSRFADVGEVTALVLPDDVPSFPRVTGQMEIGITSVGKSGNESDMLVVSAFFDFSRPDAPLNVKLEEVEGQTW
jgi:hypothetical protein